MSIPRKSNYALDITAFALSVACLLHCLAMPLLTVILPIVGMGLFVDELVHPVLLSIALPVSLIALLNGCGQHRRRSLLVAGVMGLALMALAITGLNEGQERFLTVIGVLLVAAAHLLNIFHSKYIARR
jgi:hypothetical protein